MIPCRIHLPLRRFSSRSTLLRVSKKRSVATAGPISSRPNTFQSNMCRKEVSLPSMPSSRAFAFQFLGDPRHPDQGIDKQRGDAQQIGHPVALGPSAQDLVQLVLQAQLHIDEEKQPRCKEVDKAQQKARDALYG